MRAQSKLSFIKYVAIYGATAVIFNTLLLIEGYGTLTFHFGQLIVFLCLLTQGLRAAFLVGVLSSATLAFTTGNPYFLLTLLAELLCVSWLYRRGLALFVSDIIYWCLVGIPVSFFIILFQYDFPIDYASLLLIKQLLNGLIYSLLASALLVFFPLKWCKKSARPRERSLSLRIFYLSMVTTILPALLIAILFTSKTVSTYQAELAEDMKAAAARLTLLSERYLDTHQRIISQIARTAHITSEFGELLDTTQTNFPGFVTMLRTDDEGVITHGSPRDLFEKLNRDNAVYRSVSDREYFQIPKNSGDNYISHVFQGRGFGSDSIIALSSPIHENGKFKGIVEGSLKLSRLEVMQETLDKTLGEFYIVLTDSNNRVINASPEMPFSENETFSIISKSNRYSNDSLLTEIEGQEYFYDSQKSRYGWTVYLFTKPDDSTQFFINNIVILFISLTVLSGFFLVVVKKFSSQVTVPLKSIIEQFSAQERKLAPAESLFDTKEIRQVAEQLEQSRSVMNDFNRQLKAKVDEKTQELSALNKRLEEINRRDALTGLFNRRHLDEIGPSIFSNNERNHIVTSVAAIDIDHFKGINDTYGHPGGDQCLKNLADIMRTHFTRDSDVVARYGGEEFMVVLSGNSSVEHIALLERLKAKVEQAQNRFGDDNISFTISIGVACSKNGDTLTFGELMAEADVLLYRSKALGRNRVSY